MFGFFSKPKQTLETFDADAEAFRVLQSTPRGTALLAIASPRYGDASRGDVVAPIRVVEDKVNAIQAETSGGSRQRRVARKAFPLWLANADRSAGGVSYLHEAFLDVIGPFVSEFVQSGNAHVFCPECKGSVEKVAVERSDESSSKVHSEWTEEWRCESGHLLFRHLHEMRFTY